MTEGAVLPDAALARATWQSMEPYHAMVYVVPEAAATYARIGLAPGAMHYFAPRAAAMGPVPAEMVMAAFSNFFNPELVRSVIPRAWKLVPPDRIVGARLAAADAALRRLLGEAVDRPEVAEAADLAREAASACSPAGRVLFAAHAALDWADAPHLVLWQAQTLLREYRGDGHVAALMLEGSTGLEAMVMYEAVGGMPRGIGQATRGWPDAEWARACEGLRARGWLAEDGAVTAAGLAHRQRVEHLTDELMLAPWRHLGTLRALRLRQLVEPLSRRIVDAGTFPVVPAYWTDLAGDGRASRPI